MPVIDSLQSLVFRRQFLLGPKSFQLTKGWKCFSLHHDLILSAHPDLDVLTKSNDNETITLIGVAVDSLQPNLSLSELLDNYLEKASAVFELIDNTKSLTGRWLIIFQDEQNTYLFTDACGFRSVYYYSDANGFWCGSQPEIIKFITDLDWEVDNEILDFLSSPNYSRMESAWVGNNTIYRGCRHLLPNHYLDINRKEEARFFPREKEPNAKERPLSEVVDMATTILQGTYAAVTKRGTILQALTAGWDSRVLLAASRDYSSKIEYFVDRMGILSENHPDIRIPRRLAKCLDLNLTVMNSAQDPPGWFVSVLSHNTTMARVLPKTRTIYSHLQSEENRIKLNGNGSEICRNFFTKYQKYAGEASIEVLASTLGYKDVSFVMYQLEEWRENLNIKCAPNFSIFDMLYWEQRLGNWGSQYPSEQDIAIDEFSPYCSRLLIETLMMTPREYRVAPNFKLYRHLIQAMWPETLTIPINPPTSIKAYIKNCIKPLISSSNLIIRRH